VISKTPWRTKRHQKPDKADTIHETGSSSPKSGEKKLTAKLERKKRRGRKREDSRDSALKGDLRNGRPGGSLGRRH